MPPEIKDAPPPKKTRPLAHLETDPAFLTASQFLPQPPVVDATPAEPPTANTGTQPDALPAAPTTAANPAPDPEPPAVPPEPEPSAESTSLVSAEPVAAPPVPIPIATAQTQTPARPTVPAETHTHTEEERRTTPPAAHPPGHFALGTPNERTTYLPSPEHKHRLRRIAADHRIAEGIVSAYALARLFAHMSDDEIVTQLRTLGHGMRRGRPTSPPTPKQ